ncbi:MAG: FKBP-type peptidyl-prolyl cis-trans isomerase [Williamsia sp.]|nr:FKBP-type peptidyl-prolyl cis-trans isomerase [Williamsia sp.]
MTKIKSYLFIPLLALLGACNSYEKTPSGIMYRIVSAGSGPVVRKGEILKFHYTQTINDSVLYSSFAAMPGYAKVDSVGPVYNPLEVFISLRKGDSVQIVQLADTLLKKMPPGQESIIKKGDKITLTMKVLDILNNDALVQPDQLKEMQAETGREDAAIKGYLAKKNINAQKTPKGVYVVVQSPGSGPQVDSGKYVMVRYTGKLFPSDKVKIEKVFETNTDKDPIGFTVNSGQVIPGWDEGLKQLKKGGKATLYIPSTLAYGQQPVPAGKPFENLIFDVEVVDVRDAAPPPPPMPPMMQQNGGGNQPPADNQPPAGNQQPPVNKK